ncbi:hypothetical protein DTO164E3_8935 [Paecilomyces variotii]|nr:hypothetical protein DTO164E3_8935 [Paecilomyces variotii]KAJ9223960.1 hypothetical protein DTO169C6_3580 [Paecilomyces variotii]KAJ9267108.1 hypothetical protein DTO212C5_6026 [Paecilomyces variotii]KAJ9326075.1 hypothetical protein DTO027B3_3051 [Paecilomyces variotii]KAJ9334473.1 hypothetical protein DTO027B5_3710 [Paecilomyces variotii]
MFRFARTFDVVTLFHKPSVPASQRTLNLLKVAHATATETTTIDQASDNTAQALRERGEFELEVTEEPPTPDQLRSILDYAARADPKQSISDIVRGAKDAEDALKKVKENGDNFVRPVTVDWNNGQAVVGDKESVILKMLQQLPEGENKNQ